VRLINVEALPDPGNNGVWSAAVARCRRQLHNTGACGVDDFLTTDGIRVLLGDVLAHPPTLSDKHHTVFQTPQNNSL